MTRAYAKLLGPCFKTGRRDDQLIHREPVREHQSRPQPVHEASHAIPARPDDDKSWVRRPDLYEQGKQLSTRAGSTQREASTHASSSCPASLGAIARKCTSVPSQTRSRTRLEMLPQGTLDVWLNTSGFASSIRFHLTGFTSSLTLSSKCFATFPHGTCSLSVS
jgi:hypothetical protein